jgi:hypothetical protein
VPTADRLTVHANYHDGVVELSGSLDQQMKIATDDLLRGLPDRLGQRALDLLAVASCVYAIDRVYPRVCSEENEAKVRTLRVSIAVFDKAFWSSDDTLNALTELLCALTGDIWLIAFVSRDGAHPPVTPQRPLQLGGPFSDRVALYSGGLDSAAGLANCLLDGNPPPLLLTAGHQSAIRANVRTQIAGLGALMSGMPHLLRTSFVVGLTGGAAKRLRDQEQSQRARGFLFCAAAALVADAGDLDEVLLFENGVGAINLPLTEGGLMDGFSTRGANPGILARASALFSKVLGRELRFTLPYLLRTKAEMVAGLARNPQLVTWAQQSRSCVHSSLRVAGKHHCGLCPACLERRQAFRAAGFDEDTSDYDADIFAGHAPTNPAYFYAYLENAHGWSHAPERLVDRLSRHLTLTRTTALPLNSAQGLYERHALEVQRVYGGLELGKPLQRPPFSSPQLELCYE